MPLATSTAAAALGGASPSDGTEVTSIERAVLALIVAGTLLVFWRRLTEAQAVPKLTVLAVGTVILGGVSALEIVRERRVMWRSGPATAGAACFVVAALVATVLSDDRWRSLVGQRGRGSGLVTYLLAAAVFAVLIARFSSDAVRWLAWTIAAVASVIAFLALAQRLGILGVPALVELTFGPRAAVSTLGNPNFLSGFAGVALPLCLYLAVDPPNVRWGRQVGVAAVLLDTAAIVSSRSLQGMLAGSLGVAVLVVWIALGAMRREWRRGLLVGMTVLGVSLAVPVLLGLAGRGPVAPQLDDVGRSQRLEFWGAAARMFVDHPVVGVGFDRFGSEYRSYRTSESAAAFGVADTADEPHSVPLAMLAGGGVILGAAYVAFAVGVAIELVRGLRRRAGPADGLLLAALGGAWLAYQVQSAVSIDTLPFPLLHFVLAGGVVVVVEKPRVLWQQQRTGSRSRRSRTDANPHVAVKVGVAAVCLALTWLATAPLRAAVAEASAYDAAREGNGNEAVGRMQDAHRALPWEPYYDAGVGRLLLEADRPDLALPYYERAANGDKWSLAYVLPYARLLDHAGRDDEARSWYQRVLRLEPYAAEIKVELAEFALRNGDIDGAARLLDPVAPRLADNAQAQLILGDIRRVQGQTGAADVAYARALALRPNDVALRLRLSGVYAKAGRHDQAIALLRDAVGREPTRENWTQLGVELEAAGQPQAAIKAYREATEISAYYPPAYEALRRLGAA